MASRGGPKNMDFGLNGVAVPPNELKLCQVVATASKMPLDTQHWQGHSSLFGRREGFRGCWGLLGASGSFRSRILGPEKIKSDLSRHLRQPFAAISGWIFSPGSPGPLDLSPPAKNGQKTIKIGILGPWAQSSLRAGKSRRRRAKVHF